MKYGFSKEFEFMRKNICNYIQNGHVTVIRHHVLHCYFDMRLCIMSWPRLLHDDVMKWKHFPRYWPFVGGIHRSPVDLRLNNGWVNDRDSGNLRRHRAIFDVPVMKSLSKPLGSRYIFHLQHNLWLATTCFDMMSKMNKSTWIHFLSISVTIWNIFIWKPMQLK